MFGLVFWKILRFKISPPYPTPSALAAPARAGGDERDNLLEGNGGSDGVGDRDADEEDDLEGGEEPEAPVGVEKVGKGKAEREEKGLSFGFGFAVLSKNSKEKKWLKKTHHLSPKANFVRSWYRSIRMRLLFLFSFLK